MRRVPYHQTLYDLLGIRPAESAGALGMIEAHEARMGRQLPAALREWYLVEGAVPLCDVSDWRQRAEAMNGTYWHDATFSDWPESVESFLSQLEGSPIRTNAATEGPAGRAMVLRETQSVWCWFVAPDGTADPPVVVDDGGFSAGGARVEWVRIADHFSVALLDWFAFHYFVEWLATAGRIEKLYLHTRLAFAREAPSAAPPHIDYLIDHLGDPHIEVSADGLRRYDFAVPGGGLRVTTDDCGTAGGVSAWWMHAGTEGELTRLAELAAWCGVGPWLRRCPPRDEYGVEPDEGMWSGYRAPAWRRWGEGDWVKHDGNSPR